MSNLPKHNLARVATSAAVKATPAVVYGVLVMGGSANTTFKLTNDANGSGTAVLNFAVLARTTSYFDFSDVGGVYFSSKVYATIAGTGGEAYVFYD